MLKLLVIQKFKSYFTFLLKSTNEHGVHSPFVFNLVTQCFYAITNLEQISSFLSYKKELIFNKEKIIITDFGAGSNYFKGNERLISAIAKNAGISTKRALFLIRLVQYFKPKNILELGTSLGLSTYCLHLGNPKASIQTLEGCIETSKVARTQFDKFKFYPTLTIGNFKETLPFALQNKTFDFIYIDGNHQKEATISYFEQCLKSINNDSIIIFDDIHWSKGMEEAWEIIQKNPLVTVSIDTYQWGIIFFRKEQEKEHFIIRI
ncbi:MAG: class I SAM-dependent methyltransferase [Flavobacteriaceae bacterium]|nr:class I SAM-dependent methyltransferase [Flavobacteriaceae bacterium]